MNTQQAAGQTDIALYFAALRQTRTSLVPCIDTTISTPAVSAHRTSPSRELRTVIHSALQAYNASPEGELLLKSAATLSSRQLAAALADALNSRPLQALREVIQKMEALAEKLGLPVINSISIGLEASVVLGLGIKGNFGIALPPSLDMLVPANEVIYVSGSLEEGIAEGVLGGLVIGFWSVAPSDLSGISYGWEVEIDDVVGLDCVGAYAKKDKTSALLGYSFSLAMGEEDGVEAEETYTMTFAKNEAMAYQLPAQNYMLIQNITCKKTGEVGSDELYFKFTVDGQRTYRYPSQGRFEIDKNVTWYAGRSIYFNQSVFVELFDSDGALKDESRGSITYTATSFLTQAALSGNGGQYEVTAVLNPIYA